MLDLSAADAIITTWADKYHYNFWRPWAAIRQADTDGNPATVADPSWKPMFDSTLDPAIGVSVPHWGRRRTRITRRAPPLTPVPV
jgi:hypothetical protein